MTALLKSLQSAANDFHPRARTTVHSAWEFKPRPKRPDHLRILSVVMLTASLGISCASMWLVWNMSDDVEIKPRPVVVLVPPPPAPQTPAVAPEQTTQKPAAYPDIVLPAESLQPAVKGATDDTVNLLADKILTTPALGGSENQSPNIDLLSNATQDQALNDAHLLLESGDNQAALALYGKVLVHDPNNRAALEGKMYVLQRIGQYEDAVDVGHRLLKLNPKDQDIRANLIIALSHSYKPAAMEELRQMAASDPENATLHAALAHLLMRRGYIEQAFDQLTHAVRIAPGNLSYRLDLAILYDQAGHIPDALQIYQQVLNAAADDSMAAQLPWSLTAVRQRVQYLEAVLAANTTAP